MLKVVLIAFAVLFFAPALLVALGGASPFVFLMLLAVLGFLFKGRSRSGWSRRMVIQLGSEEPAHPEIEAPRTLALPASRSDGLRARVERLEDRRSPLADRLPPDPLECEDLVAGMAVLTHEPAEVRARLEAEYRTRAKRFADWSGDLTLLRSRLGDQVGLAGDPRLEELEEEAGRLETEIDELAAYVADLRARADDAATLPASALEAAVRAGETLDRAREALAASTDPPAETAAELEQAAAKLHEAWAALAEGEERPQTALRLAEEVESVASEAEERLGRIAGLPAVLERGQHEFPSRHADVSHRLEEVHERFLMAAQTHPASSWSEIEGVGAEAERELDRAQRLWQSAAATGEPNDPAALETVGATQEQAFAALAAAAALVDRIGGHLDRLERAALEGRDRVLAAEKEIDRAWADLSGSRGNGRDDLLGRAAALAAQARAEMDESRPDWLRISELAERSLELAKRAEAESGLEPDWGPRRRDPDRRSAAGAAPAEVELAEQLVWGGPPPADDDQPLDD